MRMSIRFSCFLLLLLTAREIRALDPSQPVDSYIRTRFSTEEGLYRFDRGGFSSSIPRLAIGRIEEASNGHLLVITSQGFMEWDGSRAVQDLELPAQLGVRADRIYHVFEDSHGVTWFCTVKG